jgi:hypothetical protein
MSFAAYDSHPLIQYLRNPQVALAFSARQWERLLRSARHGSLSSRVGWLAEQSGLMVQLPEKIQFHFQSALRVAQSQAVSVNWEVAQIQKALAEPNIPFVILKGGAYIKGKFAAAHGRVLSDVDIMVPKSRLNDAEKALYAAGWFPTKLNAYDQRYYREWMHELPPMQHLDRGTTLDLHHTILPPTALLKPDVDLLWAAASPIEGEKGVFVLSPVDMVLHSATHLFHDGELEHGLRDLVDMDALIRQFAVPTAFFQSLIDRAEALNLGRPLHYALKYCKLFLNTPIPDAIYERSAGLGSQSVLIRKVMDIAVARSIGRILEVKPSAKTRLSEFAMYVRSHYLRMPLHQLIPHLLRKQFVPSEEVR